MFSGNDQNHYLNRVIVNSVLLMCSSYLLKHLTGAQHSLRLLKQLVIFSETDVDTGVNKLSPRN
jgi:hypothetical protein